MKKQLLILIFVILNISCFSQTTTDINSAAEKLYTNIKKTNKDAIKPFDDPIRKKWSHLPKKGRGEKFTELESKQELLLKLLETVFATRGYNKTLQILKSQGEQNFYFCFYGDPSKDDKWGFSLEGPYLSLNITIVGDKISYTPMLMGGNPTKFAVGEKMDDNMRVEEGIPADFMSMLSKGQLEKAVVSETSTGKIVYGLKDNLEYSQGGIEFKDLEGDQQTTFFSMILSTYLNRVHKPLTSDIYDRLYKNNTSSLKLMWKGDIKDNSEHYYMVSTPTLIIEYVNIESETNHVINVVREVGFDFGEQY